MGNPKKADTHNKQRVRFISHMLLGTLIEGAAGSKGSES